MEIFLYEPQMLPNHETEHTQIGIDIRQALTTRPRFPFFHANYSPNLFIFDHIVPNLGEGTWEVIF